MKKTILNETQKCHILIKVLGITVLAILILVSIAGATPYTYVRNQADHTFSVIDTVTNKVVTTVPANGYQTKAVVTPDGTKTYVAKGDGNVYVYDPTTNTLITTIDAGIDPFWGFEFSSALISTVAISPDGKYVYAVDYDANCIAVIGTATDTVISYRTVWDHPWGVAVSPDGSKLFITTADTGELVLVIFDLATNSIIDEVNLDEVAKSDISVPEFPSVALPVVAVLGLISIIGCRKE